MTSRKKILVIGGNGQDGAHLCHQLLSQGYKVYCSIRSKESNTWRLKELNIINKINLVNIDILNLFPYSGPVPHIDIDDQGHERWL